MRDFPEAVSNGLETNIYFLHRTSHLRNLLSFAKKNLMDNITPQEMLQELNQSIDCSV